MLLILSLVILLVNLFVTALPSTSLAELSTVDPVNPLNSRQIIAEGTAMNCCSNCGARYDYSTFWHTFDDFCNWAGNGLELWTTQIYYTGSYYCPEGSPICIHLEVQFLCDGSDGEGEAVQVSYSGCMGLFEYAINPPGVCGGPPYPGAHVQSADGCWIFQATADITSQWNGDMELLAVECDESRRWCTRPGSNQTVDTYTGPKHQFGPPSRL